MLDVLTTIANRAASLDDRIGPAMRACDAAVDRVPFRLERWRQNAAGGDAALFDRRLQLEGIDTGALPALLGAAEYIDPARLPPWVDTLRELIDSTRVTEIGDRAGRQPFEELFAAHVEFAASRLQTMQGADPVVAHDVLAPVRRALLNRLSRICARPLALELNIARMHGRLRGNTPEARYRDFVACRVGTPEGLLSFFAEYPVAGRLVATVVRQWIAATDEFLTRLRDDRSALTVAFGSSQRADHVVAIRDQVSDAHNGGRSAKVVTFASGLRVLYKPKDLTLDEGFQDLLAWVNEQGPRRQAPSFLPLAGFRLLNRRTHGWVEHLEPTPCADRAEVDRYFQRAGRLLALLHMLGATDCTHENLFACGEYPILIDLETLLEARPAPPSHRPPTADELAQRHVEMSLLHTGMLPRLVFGDPGEPGSDFSGLMTGATDQHYPFRLSTWVEAQTDRMRLDVACQEVGPSGSRLVLDGAEVSARDYQDAIERGFLAMYDLLLASRDSLLESGLLDRLCTGPVRYLNRPTMEYAVIQQKSLDPWLLREGIDRSLHLDLLHRSLFLHDRESVSALVGAERRAMERLDVPYFSIEARSSTLWSDRRDPQEAVAMVPPRDRLFERVARLSAHDRDTQVQLMRANWFVRGSSTSGSAAGDIVAGPPADRMALVRAAAGIGAQLAHAAIRAADGTVTWVGAQYVAHLGQFSILPVGHDLYSGTCGIALFLAALDRVDSGRGHADLARGAVALVRARFLSDKAVLYARPMGIGAMGGLGGICWTLAHLASSLQAPDLLDDAAAIGALITPDLIARDRHLDIMGGCAGAIVSLLSLDDRLGGARFVAQADACGQHLLARSVRIGPGLRAWPTVRGERLAGLSHGAAGYAYALCRLYQATGRRAYRDAATEALAYERTLYSAEARNWADLRRHNGQDTRPGFMTGWCHGAPGAALARIGCLDVLDDEPMRHEIDVGLQTTLDVLMTPNDDACCGNVSRIATLLIASTRLGRPDLSDAAATRAGAIVGRAAATGTFRIDPDIGGALNPGFMKGIAGVGYALLRLADRDQSLPSPWLM